MNTKRTAITNRFYNKSNLSILLMGIALSIIAGCQSGNWNPFNRSVKPGINEHYKNMDSVDTWVNRFESESREIFRERENILKALELKEGMRVADIGAGTGFFTLMFAQQVGPTGRVYAVDITPEFVKRINTLMKDNNLSNVRTVLCKEDSAQLQPESVDLVFICDTYHHFEYPKPTMQSIYKALKPGGQLIVIDFDRIPHVSREWLLDHVRIGRDKTTSEIASYGFTFDKDIEIGDYLKDNYFLRFHKPGS